VTGIPLRVLDAPPEGDAEPGMMWRYPDDDTAGRECWWIALPNTKPREPGYASEITWRTTDRASSPPHEMWEVTGTPPLITVSPSIDVECWVNRDGQTVREGSYWHGFIRDGVLVT
jgi:hypothetical protein